MAAVRLLANIMHHGEILSVGTVAHVDQAIADDWTARGLAKAEATTLPAPAPIEPDIEPAPTTPDAPSASNPSRRERRRQRDSES